MKDIYSRMIEVIQHRLAATGIPQQKAISAGIAVAETFRAELGGREVYLPKRCPYRDRDIGIRRDFNGRNMTDICEKYEVSPRTVYRKTRGNQHF